MTQWHFRVKVVQDVKLDSNCQSETALKTVMQWPTDKILAHGKTYRISETHTHTHTIIMFMFVSRDSQFPEIPKLLSTKCLRNLQALYPHITFLSGRYERDGWDIVIPKEHDKHQWNRYQHTGRQLAYVTNWFATSRPFKAIRTV